MSSHIVLLGDSIFDNRAYTGGQPDVVGHLRALLPSPWGATLRAVDGSMVADLDAQLAEVPDEASHIVISVGGNDALMNSDILGLPVSSTTEAFILFEERIASFESGYRRAVERALGLGRDTAICTIYNGNLPQEQGRLARMALMMFNDVIIRVGIEYRLRMIDLRLVCDSPEDYANPIEPSGSGGRKIAESIARAVGAIADNGEGREASRIFA